MRTITLIFLFLITTGISYAQEFKDFKGVSCESVNVTHTKFLTQKIIITRESGKETFQFVHIPEYDSKTESPRPITRGVDLVLSELDTNRPYLVDLTNGSNISNSSKIGTYIESREYSERSPYYNSSSERIRVVFKINKYLVDGHLNAHTISTTSVEFHPSDCQEIR